MVAIEKNGQSILLTTQQIVDKFLVFQLVERAPTIGIGLDLKQKDVVVRPGATNASAIPNSYRWSKSAVPSTPWSWGTPTKGCTSVRRRMALPLFAQNL